MRIAPSVVILLVLVAGSVWAVMASVGGAPVQRYQNALVPTLALGDEVGDFALKDIGGELRTLSQWRGKKATVLYFWSVDCPCVEQLEMRVKELQDRFRGKGVEFIAIDSHPDDTQQAVLDHMVAIHADYRMLLDPEGRVAKRVGGLAATDAILLDGEGRIRYRGGISDALNKPKIGYLGDAIEAVLAGRTPSPQETKTLGCPYPGNEGVCAERGS
jgi:peroxiredoxin